MKGTTSKAGLGREPEQAGVSVQRDSPHRLFQRPGVGSPEELRVCTAVRKRENHCIIWLGLWASGDLNRPFVVTLSASCHAFRRGPWLVACLVRS